MRALPGLQPRRQRPEERGVGCLGGGGRGGGWQGQMGSWCVPSRAALRPRCAVRVVSGQRTDTAWVWWQLWGNHDGAPAHPNQRHLPPGRPSAPQGPAQQRWPWSPAIVPWGPASCPGAPAGRALTEEWGVQWGRTCLGLQHRGPGAHGPPRPGWAAECREPSSWVHTSPQPWGAQLQRPHPQL